MKKIRLHSPSAKLASKYLAIIMVISVLFSISMYVTSVQEIGRGYGRIGAGMNRTLNPQQLIELREAQLDMSRTALRNRLIVINIFILFFGGALSYYLARKTLEPIETAQEAQSRFTSDASHELRTPITAIRTETEAFLLDPKSTLQGSKTIMKSTLEELDKLTSLTDGLLRLARASKQSLKRTSTTPQALVEDSVARIKPHAAKKDITINTTLRNKTRPIDVDIDLLSDAVSILLENAIKYCKPGSEITLSSNVTKSTLVLVVEDKGAGIKQSQIPYIFERFYQGDSSRNKSQTPGFGIGLSIVKSIIDLHGGSISVDSTLGKGSTFTITIPL